MTGFCPQCQQGKGLCPCQNQPQRWSKPKLILVGRIPPELADKVPFIITGHKCGHTISLRSWQVYNLANTS